MNKINLQEILKEEFDEMLMILAYKSWIEEEIKRLEGEKKTLPLEIDLEIDAIGSSVAISNQGYNACLQDQINYLKDKLKEIE